jgi:hypothetical protein
VGFKTMVLVGAALAAMPIGFAAPAFAAAQAVPASHVITGLPSAGGDRSDDVSGQSGESPLCSALGTESIPTGDVVGSCLVGTSVV